MVQLCSSLRACGLALLGASSLLGTSAIAQQASREPTLAAIKTDSAVKVPPASNDPAADGANEFTPSWETQKTARTYLLSIPAPRGQIVDRNGAPLAQTRVSYNLAIAFPTPLTMNERAVLAFAQQQVARAQTLIARPITLSRDGVLKHYKNRGVLPYVIAQDLQPPEIEAVERDKSGSLTLQPIYQRHYPNGALAGHVIGYAGRGGKMPDGPIENNELLWPNAEGRDGLEQSFDDQLQGKFGQYNISFDPKGAKATEQISIPPQPGYNVVTTLDVRIQRLCEEALDKGLKRGAMVVLDPNNGDVLALASWPPINPNDFVPNISAEKFKALQDDTDIPLLPRAFRSAYPPGSVFKVFVGLAAMQTGKIGPEDQFSCPPSLAIGNLTFRNWKKVDSGSLNFADALMQSCNTWFYQVGMRLGSRPITDYSLQVGLGARTGIPLNAEADGRIPSDEYMMKVYKRRMLNGDVANFSIGQGDTLVSPLQMAQAMGVIGNGGTFYQTRLVQQVQSLDDQIVNAYNLRARGQVAMDKRVLATLKQGLVQVVAGRAGTAGRAAVPGIAVAGKTGTAQWGPKNRERTAAWFAGFAPAENPKYAFAVVYEGEANNDDVHGGTQAAPIAGRVLRELFKSEKKENGKKKRKRRGEPEPEEEAEPPIDSEEDGVRVRRAEPVSADVNPN
ncbi:MAG TPA: penicillin-binding protein 2 [Chthoniobacteraceae bacterium]|jgi:penicillin-binding protein 2